MGYSQTKEAPAPEFPQKFPHVLSRKEANALRELNARIKFGQTISSKQRRLLSLLAKKSRQRPDDQFRHDTGIIKGPGFQGSFTNPEGQDVSEFSVGIPINGQETNIPSIVEDTTPEEINSIVNSATVPESAMRKAQLSAENRIGQGQSPFLEIGEREVEPTPNQMMPLTGTNENSIGQTLGELSSEARSTRVASALPPVQEEGITTDTERLQRAVDETQGEGSALPPVQELAPTPPPVEELPPTPPPVDEELVSQYAQQYGSEIGQDLQSQGLPFQVEGELPEPTDITTPLDISRKELREGMVESFVPGLERVGKDYVNLVKGLYEDPGMAVDIAKELGKMGLGGIQKLIPGEQASEESFNQIANHLKERYGSIENFKRTLATDSGGVAAVLAELAIPTGLVSKPLITAGKKAVKTAVKTTKEAVDTGLGKAVVATKTVDVPVTGVRNINAPEAGISKGVNIRDKEQAFTDEILAGSKTIETRNSHSLKNKVGERVGIIRTGKDGKAMLVGYADVGKPKKYTNEKAFRADESLHRVKKGSTYDIKEGGVKFGYPLTNVTKLDTPIPITSKGIISRDISMDVAKFGGKGKDVRPFASASTFSAAYKKNLDDVGGIQAKDAKAFDDAIQSTNPTPTVAEVKKAKEIKLHAAIANKKLPEGQKITLPTILDAKNWVKDTDIRMLTSRTKEPEFLRTEIKNGKKVKVSNPKFSKMNKEPEFLGTKIVNGKKVKVPNPKFDKTKITYRYDNNLEATLDALQKDPRFKELGIFDRANVVSILHRSQKKNVYGPTKEIGQNAKMEGTNIFEADTIRGCGNNCYGCYACKLAAIGKIDFEIEKITNIKGKIKPHQTLRIGVSGDPAADWAHTAREIQKVLKNSPGTTSENNVMFITKLQNIDGFDPKVIRNLQISLDPLNPAQMEITMKNLRILKKKYPERFKNIATNETPMRLNKNQHKIIEGNDKYVTKNNQLQLPDDKLQAKKAFKWRKCGEKLGGSCIDCKGCATLGKKGMPNIELRIRTVASNNKALMSMQQKAIDFTHEMGKGIAKN